jgi:hypothetical protein
MYDKLFSTILYANDVSKHSLRAFELPPAIAKQTAANSIWFPSETSTMRLSLSKMLGNSRGEPHTPAHSITARSRNGSKQKPADSLPPPSRESHPGDRLARPRSQSRAAHHWSKGHSEVYERVVRSIANQIMQLAQCPALVVKSDPTAGTCLSELKLGRSKSSHAGIRFPRPYASEC